jgi:hypothetical protein
MPRGICYLVGNFAGPQFWTRAETGMGKSCSVWLLLKRTGRTRAGIENGLTFFHQFNLYPVYGLPLFSPPDQTLAHQA